MRHPPNPQVGTGGFVVPGAPTAPVPAANAPRLVNFTGVPEGMRGNQYYGQGLAGIDEQRQALAQAAGQGLENVREPFGGAAYLVNQLERGMRENMAANAETATRNTLASLMGGIDPKTGPTMQQVQQAYEADPAFGEKLYAQLLATQNVEHWEPVPGMPGVQRNVRTGETKSAGQPEGAGGPKLSDVNSFTGRIVGMPSYKNLAQSQGAWAQMSGAYTRNTPQADLSMVIALAKLYDPDSVVREGEVETVKKTGNLPSELYAQFLYLTGEEGSRLHPDVRKGMLQEGYAKIKGFEQAWQNDRKYFLDQAARYGFNPADVPDFAPVGELETEEPPPPDEDPDEPGTLPYPGEMPEGWPAEVGWPTPEQWKSASAAKQRSIMDIIKKQQQPPAAAATQ